MSVNRNSSINNSPHDTECMDIMFYSIFRFNSSTPRLSNGIRELYYVNTLHEEYVLPGDDFKGIYEYVKEYPDRNIYAEGTVLARIRYYSGFKKKEELLHDIFSTPFNKVLPDSFVVRDGSRGPVENPVQRRVMEEKFRTMPPTWRLEKTVVGNPLGCYGLFDPKIYHIPK